MTQFYCLNCACLREFVPGARYWCCVECGLPGVVITRAHSYILKEEFL